MIEEKIINGVLDQLEKADFEEEMEIFRSDYPVVYSYLMNEQLESLSEEEYQLMIFDAIVIIKSFELAGHGKPKISAVRLEEIESSNWSLLHNSKPAAFNEKLDVFFKDTMQEDLLAYIEDSLAEDDEFQISSAAREIIFICLKSVLDLFADDK